MNNKHRPSSWIIIALAAMLVVLFCFLGYRSFKAMEMWAIGVQPPPEETQQLIWSTYITLLAVVGVSILVVVAGAVYLLRLSFRARRNLEREVRIQAAELLETNRKLNDALNALEEAHAFQQSIIDGMALPLMVIDPDYRIRLMNRAAREFSHGSGEASDAVYCYQVSHQHYAPCKERGYPCPMEQVRESRRPATMIHEHYRPDGEKRFVKVLAAPLLGPDGGFQGIVEVSHDVTEQKKIQEALARQMEGIKDTYDDLDEFSSKVARSIQDFFAKLPSE